MIPLILAATLLLVALAAGLIARQRRAEHRLQTTRLCLAVPGLAPALRGLRIAFLADLHEGRLYVPREELLAAVEEADPGLLLLGGDYACSGRYRAAALELVADLADGRPTFAVLGNTDHYQRLDPEVLGTLLRKTGGDLLVNGAGRLEIGAATIEILGVDDPLHGHADVARTLAQAHGGADLRVAITHSPALWQELRRFEAHICLCGHTHGGQVRLPLLEALMTHLSYPRRLAAGLFRYRDHEAADLECVAGHWRILGVKGRPIHVDAAAGPLLYVSRGVGVGAVPFRFLCPPELVVIELVPGDEPEGEHG